LSAILGVLAVGGRPLDLSAFEAMTNGIAFWDLGATSPYVDSSVAFGFAGEAEAPLTRASPNRQEPQRF
jgi:hypothetical protein